MSREVRIVFWLVALIALGFIIKVLNDVLIQQPTSWNVWG
jgi:Ni/Fe-hydrogenase subunit HybB-like protein